jgi:hypothetical protein
MQFLQADDVCIMLSLVPENNGGVKKAVDRLTKSEHHILCGILASF